MYISRNNYNSCIGTEEGPQKGKSGYWLAQGVGKNMQLKGLAKRQIKDYNICVKALEMIMDNMNEALISDSVNDKSMMALAEEFKGIAFLRPGWVLIGELNEDMVTTKLIVTQRLAEIEEKSEIKKLHARAIWETGAHDGIAVLVIAGKGMYTTTIVFVLFEHWDLYRLVLCIQI